MYLYSIVHVCEAQWPDHVQSMSRSQLLSRILARSPAISAALTPSQPSISPSIRRCGQARSRLSTAAIVSS